ncbi:MAG: tyrosine-protein phosphatase [Gemmataceae bacterium]
MVAVRWALGILVAVAVVGVPFGYFRAGYVHAKRLRVVTDGKVYRSGQLPADGFREAFRRFDIKTVINLQEEARDPHIPRTWLTSWVGKPDVLESELCKQSGVKYVTLDGGVLDTPDNTPGGRPKVIDDFLAICDDPANYPILLHCKAGLHRTGLLTAVYRMEYEKRPQAEVVREMLANGFGTFGATDGNAYLDRLIAKYEPGVRKVKVKSQKEKGKSEEGRAAGSGFSFSLLPFDFLLSGQGGDR